MKASTTVGAARVALVLGAAGCAWVTFSPYHSLQEAYASWGKGFHLIVAYGLTALAFLSFPRSRRTDMVLAGWVLAGLFEAARMVLAHDARLGDWAADVMGAGAVMAPTYVEAIRKAHRERASLSVHQMLGHRRRKPAKTPTAASTTA